MEDTTGQGPATNENPAPTKAEIKAQAAEQKSAAAADEAAMMQVADTTPTRAEAREMFKGNPGLWSVLTTEGPMTRDQC